MRIGHIATTSTITCTADESIQGAALLMRQRGIRRVPVVSADDLLAFLSEEMGELSRIASHRQNQEKHAKH